MNRIVIIVILSLLILASRVPGSQPAVSAEKGKQLFTDPALGTNGKSCNTCHPGGKGLASAGTRADIMDIINGCVTVSLKGKALDPSSPEMQSLILYLKSLSQNKSSRSAPSHGC